MHPTQASMYQCMEPQFREHWTEALVTFYRYPTFLNTGYKSEKKNGRILSTYYCQSAV